MTLTKFVCLLFTTVLFLLPTNDTHGAERPNIVFILADDLGYGDTGCYGGDRCQIETAEIDQLAAEGLRFTDAHVNASVCAPTRIAAMTGRYAWRFGRSRSSGPWGFVGPKPNVERHTLAKLLNAAGYNTGYIGKWHLGTIMTTVDGKSQNPANVDFKQPLKLGPVQFGFAYSFILPGSLDMFPYVFARNNVWQGEVTAQKGWSAFNRVGPAERDFEDHEVLETFYGEAESFLGRQTSDKPFFLFIALTAPHTPTSPGVAWRLKSRLGVYGDFVMEVDHSVRRVREALMENDLDGNTLILFSSDHGAAPYAGNILTATTGQIHDLERAGHYASGIYRGFKFSSYEGGLRVPLIAHWPGIVPAGSECDELVGLNDIMATLAELTDQSLGESDGPDSISFAKLLRDPSAEGERKQLIMQSAMEVFSVRDGKWKLCLSPGSGAKDEWQMEPLETAAWRKSLNAFGKSPTRDELTQPVFAQLFDLSADPQESNNLARLHPERVARMVQTLKDSIANGRSTPGRKLTNDKPKVRIHQRLPDFLIDVVGR